MKKIPHFKYRTHYGRYEITEDWEYESIKIPKNYATNGVSIPRLFWFILSPFNPNYIEECTIHDYLCDQEQYRRADAWFEQLLIDNTEIKIWHRKIFIFSVRTWHRCAYRGAGYYDPAQPRVWLKVFKKMFK